MPIESFFLCDLGSLGAATGTGAAMLSIHTSLNGFSSACTRHSLAHTHTYTYTYTYIHKCTYTHTCIYTYTQPIHIHIHIVQYVHCVAAWSESAHQLLQSPCSAQGLLLDDMIGIMNRCKQQWKGELQMYLHIRATSEYVHTGWHGEARLGPCPAQAKQSRLRYQTHTQGNKITDHAQQLT